MFTHLSLYAGYTVASAIEQMLNYFSLFSKSETIMTHKTLNIIKLYKITAYNAHVKTSKENYEKYLCPNLLNCFF